MKNRKLRIGVLGLFCWKTDRCDGQTVKTRNLWDLLTGCEEFEVGYVDSCQWKKHPFLFFFRIIKLAFSSDVIVMMPDAGGIKVYPFILIWFRLLKKRLYYNVVGGWLPGFTQNSKIITALLKKYDGIIVETGTMNKRLCDQGFSNVVTVPNFKDLNVVSEFPEISAPPYRFCIFSRVMAEKGVTSAAEVFSKINSIYGKNVCRLDVYGPVTEEYREEFEKLLEKHRDFMKYGGIKKPEDAPETIKNYYMLLFPTLFYTEGVPGTIIDSYSAGVPVLASRWESWRDILSDETAVTYEFKNEEDFCNKLIFCINNPERIAEKKKSCVERAAQYHTASAGEKIKALLQGKQGRPAEMGHKERFT